MQRKTVLQVYDAVTINYKLQCLVHLVWKAIDEARARLGLECGMRRILEELDGHIHRYDVALADDIRIRSV